MWFTLLLRFFFKFSSLDLHFSRNNTSFWISFQILLMVRDLKALIANGSNSYFHCRLFNFLTRNKYKKCNNITLVAFAHTSYLSPAPPAVLLSKFSGWCQKKCELLFFGVKIMNFVFFGVKKSGISVFLVLVLVSNN